MICQKLQDYLCRDPGVDADIVLGTADFAGHIAHCRECNRLVEAHKELQRELQLVRNSAPPVPPSLNRTVLVNYRNYASNQSRSARSGPSIEGRGSLLGVRVLGGAACLAFTVAVAYAAIVLFSSGERVPARTVRRQQTTQLTIASQAVTTQDGAALRIRKPVAKMSKLQHILRRNGHRESNAKADHWPPTGFRSLMYCDELSCAGAMGVMRVQLPAPLMGLTLQSSQRSVPVFADVLVGPDGIARGIRVVE